MVVFGNMISRDLADAEGSETSPFEVKSQGLQELGCLVSSFPFSFHSSLLICLYFWGAFAHFYHTPLIYHL